MKLWLLKRPENAWGYDEALGFVIRASSEAAARLFASGDCGDEGNTMWLDRSQTTCVELSPTGDAAIVLRDFNAG